MKFLLFVLFTVVSSGSVLAGENNCTLKAYFYTPEHYLTTPVETVIVSANTLGECVESVVELNLFDLRRNLKGPGNRFISRAVKNVEFIFLDELSETSGNIKRPARKM